MASSSRKKMVSLPLPQRGDNDAHLFAQTRTLRIRHIYGLKLSSDGSTSPHLATVILPRLDFHGVSRAVCPQGHICSTSGFRCI